VPDRLLGLELLQLGGHHRTASVSPSAGTWCPLANIA
jgi:hypothetical protein